MYVLNQSLFQILVKFTKHDQWCLDIDNDSFQGRNSADGSLMTTRKTFLGGDWTFMLCLSDIVLYIFFLSICLKCYLKLFISKPGQTKLLYKKVNM